MLIYTCYFGPAPFDRLARALEASVKANCPTARFVAEDIGESHEPARMPRHTSFNTAKLRRWRDVALETTEDLVLMDADTLVLRDLQTCFGTFDFDLAYTVRPGRCPINGGVIYMRPTDAAKRLMGEWYAVNRAFLDLFTTRHQLSRCMTGWGGLNQAALGILLGSEPDYVQTAALPCEVFNCVDQTWAAFGEGTAVLHVKGKLRQMILGNQDFKHLRHLAELWREYDGASSSTETAGCEAAVSDIG